MNEHTRTRGLVQVYPMPDAVNGPGFDRYALAIRPDGELRMVHYEGVAYKVSDDKPWCWTDYNPDERKFTPEELVKFAHETEPVDLADWVRTFGSRLESNYCQITWWYTEGDE